MAYADRTGYITNAPQYVYNPADFPRPPSSPHKSHIHAHVTSQPLWTPPTPISPNPPPPYSPGQSDQGYFPPPPKATQLSKPSNLPNPSVANLYNINGLPRSPPSSPGSYEHTVFTPPTPQTPAIQIHPETQSSVAQIISNDTTGAACYYGHNTLQPLEQPQQNPAFFKVSQWTTTHPTLSHQQPNQALQPPPITPPRPLSAPPEHRLQLQADVSAATVVNANNPLAHSISAPASVPAQAQDDMKTGTATRFFGNMLAVRGARAVCSSVKATATLPFYLSPWGDNNPVTLPHIRKRDVALAGLMHIGIGELAPAAMDVIDHAVQTGITWTAEQAVDTAHHKMGGARPHKIVRQGDLSSLTIRIRHKLLGEEAVVKLAGQRECFNKSLCSKGWFCPYLYASGRALHLERSIDFSMAQLYSPGLAADASIAPTLLSSISAQAGSIVATCPYQSPCPTHPLFRRFAIFMVGISPYRTASAWSQAKIPNEARLTFHVLTHFPAIVLPVSNQAPVCAWSPWTLRQMLYGGDGHDASRQYYELLEYLETVVDEDLMDIHSQKQWRNMVGNGLRTILEVAQQLRLQIGTIEKVNNFDLDRAGIVMFRY